MPTIIIIAGPNGAGKTTFAREYLKQEERSFEFVNADEIARSLTIASDVAAARIMLTKIDQLVAARADFVIETTLANLTYARKIPIWKNNGYLMSLVYLRLNSAEDSVARVRKRVTAGGHTIPEDVIRRRFAKSFSYFENVYRPIVDEWYVWESGDGILSLVDSWDQRHAART